MIQHPIQQYRLSTIALMGFCMAGLAGTLLSASAAPETAGGANIALGRSVTFNAPPGYPLCTDPDDDKQLTDGLYSSRGDLKEVDNTTSIWVQKGTVGWIGVYPIITVDLGKVQPISGASYSTAGGRAGVSFPENIYVSVSDDGKDWHYIGDLAALSEAQPPKEGEAVVQYSTRKLRTKGRYVAFAVVSTPYTFTDEVEVYSGEESWLSQPAGGEKIADVKSFMLQTAVASRVRGRLNTDIAAIRAQINGSTLAGDRLGPLTTKLGALEESVKTIKTVPVELKTILPLNETHGRILGLHGELLAAQGHKPLTLWKTPRYAFVPLLATPPQEGVRPVLDFSMLKNQFRSDALLLTNATGTPQKVTLKVSNPPAGAKANWLQLSSVAWTDTYNSLPVADAMLPLTAKTGFYEVTVPAGMTRKVWMIVDSSKLMAGNTRSILEVRGPGLVASLPLNVSVAKLAMPTPRFSLGMWDYTDGGPNWGVTPQNRKSAIALMRSHYVDTPWANPRVLPIPAAEDFDAAGNLKSKLNFAKFDEWVALWPGAKRYFVFANLVNETFGGAPVGSPEFKVRAGSWAKALSAHMKTLGLKPDQLGLLLVDEPRMKEQDIQVAAWAKAINASAPELTLFSDPIWERPDQTEVQEAITEIDVLCPQLNFYMRAGKPVADYYERLRQKGKELWLYQCDGPVRSFSPQRYYRYTAWHAFAMGATGHGYWAFGDSSGAPTSWQTYLATGVGYEPAFLDSDKVYNSVHWESVREGVEDYEELAMLRDAIKLSKNAALRTQAQKVLNDAVSAVTGTWSQGYIWQEGNETDLADRHLRQVRAMLVRLSA